MLDMFPTTSVDMFPLTIGVENAVLIAIKACGDGLLDVKKREIKSEKWRIYGLF